ncbi:MAG TPA: diguanylate cyclase [Polyangiaceae bacterium]|nr:diguanylate cyclase [Polyangiaceae bacterium]
MSVRVKILLVLALVFAVFSVSNFGVQESILLPNFEELEREKAASSMESCRGAVQREIEALATTTHDWGNWDPMYQYAADHNPQFVEDNVSTSNLESARLDLLVISGLQGEVIFRQIRPLPAAEMMALEVAVHEMVAAAQPLRESHSKASLVQGIHMTRVGPLFVAAQPITNNDGSAPSRGVLIMGRLFTRDDAKSIAERTKIDFEYHDLVNETIGHDQQGALGRIDNKAAPDLWEIDASSLRASILLHDIGDKPALLLTALLPRDIMGRGQDTVRFAQLSLLASALIFLVAIWLALERVVLARLGRLSAAVRRVGHSERVIANIEVDGSDEVGSLGRDINHMLDRLREAEGRLQRLALYDALTELPNRVLLLDRMDKALTQTRRRAPYGFGVMMLDLDGFKQINDTIGHEAGDQVLAEVARRLNDAVRPGDTVARMGGDEFAVLLADLQSVSAAEQICRRIIERVNRPIPLGDREATVGVSIGFALCDRGQANRDTLLRDADTAMYCAKASGKNQWRAFDPDRVSFTRVVAAE